MLGAISPYATQYYVATGPQTGCLLEKESLIQIFSLQKRRDQNIKEQEHIFKINSQCK